MLALEDVVVRAADADMADGQPGPARLRRAGTLPALKREVARRPADERLHGRDHLVHEM